MAVTIAFAGAFLYNVYRIDRPWIRLGQAWTLGAIIYLFAPALDGGPRRLGAGDPCARFLVNQHEERRFGYLRIRGRLFLLIPGIFVCWWGGGFYSSPWPFLIAAATLSLVWAAFGRAAGKAARERDEILRTIESGGVNAR